MSPVSSRNDKVAKLARMTAEAKYETVVMSDSDVRVEPDYLRTIVAPTGRSEGRSSYVFLRARWPAKKKPLCSAFNRWECSLIFMQGFWLPGSWMELNLPWVLRLPPRVRHLAGFGGYAAIENRPADDLLVGRLIAEQGYEVELPQLCDSHRVRLPIAARPISEAPALDGGDAHHVSVGTSGPDFYSWTALGAGSDLCSANARK